MHFAPPRQALPLLLLAFLALLAALWAGLIRLGWAWPPLQALWVAYHGPLMIGGFLGTLVSLERASALATWLKHPWPYLAPLAAALGGLLMLLGLPLGFAQALLTVGSAMLVVIFGVIYQRHLDTAHGVMGLGAVLWLLGNGLWWSGWPLYRVVPLWIVFLILTIAGERLELARILILHRTARWLFNGCVVGLLLSLGMALFDFTWGVRLSGVSLAALGLWLWHFDLARRTVRHQAGLPRFIAACLLPGYVWLIFTGALWLIGAASFAAGPLYDAMLHAALVGFVFSMIFGHAPIILPALTGRAITYHWRLYVPLVVLHLALILRISGDLALGLPLRQWGGLLNAVAILLFLGNQLLSLRMANRG